MNQRESKSWCIRTCRHIVLIWYPQKQTMDFFITNVGIKCTHPCLHITGKLFFSSQTWIGIYQSCFPYTEPAPVHQCLHRWEKWQVIQDANRKCLTIYISMQPSRNTSTPSQILGNNKLFPKIQTGNSKNLIIHKCRHSFHFKPHMMFGKPFHNSNKNNRDV